MTMRSTPVRGNRAILRKLLVLLLLVGGASYFSTVNTQAQEIMQATNVDVDSETQGRFDPIPYYLDDHMHADIVGRICTPPQAEDTSFNTIKALQEERERRMIRPVPAPGVPAPAPAPGVAPAAGAPGAPAMPSVPAGARPESTY